jgi:NADPH:quinone reductase
MRAARIHRWGSTPIVEEVADPVVKHGESIVRVAAAAVGHFDLNVASGEHRPLPPLPYVPGTDGAGEVVASEAYEPGTAVLIRGGGLGLRRDGTWAELAAVPDDALEPAPEGVDPAVAASFSVPAAAAFAAVTQLGELRPGEHVAVTGAAGAVGGIAVQLARRAGAGSVFGIVSRAAKADAVPAAATVLVGRGPGVAEQLRDRTAGIDLLVDTVGGPALAEILPAMSPGGRAVLVGYTAGRAVTLDLPTLMDLDVTLLPLNLFRHPARTREGAAQVLGLLRQGELDLPLTRFSLDELPAAVDSLTKGETVGRVVLVPGPGPRLAPLNSGGTTHEQAAA